MGGLRLPRHPDGAGGLGKHSLDDLNRIIAGHNVGLDFNVDDDAFTFAGRTTPADLQLQLQVLAAYFADPGYRPESLQRFRQGMGALYTNLTRTPGGVLFEAATTAPGTAPWRADSSTTST